MNEKNKLLVLLAIVILFVVSIVFGTIISKNESNRIWKDVRSAYNSSDTKVIYIGGSNYYYSKDFIKIIDQFKDQYNFDYTYVNVDVLKDTEFNKIISLLFKDLYNFDYNYVNINLLKQTDFSRVISLLNIQTNIFDVPYLIILKNRQVIGIQIGYTEESNLFNILQNYGLISKSVSNPYIAGDNNKVVAAFNAVFKTGYNKLIYIGRPTCGYCQKLVPILDELKNEYGFDYYYINTDEISSAELQAILIKLNVDYATFGTPYLAVVNNNTVISRQPGYVEKEVLREFLKESNIID